MCGTWTYCAIYVAPAGRSRALYSGLTQWALQTVGLVPTGPKSLEHNQYSILFYSILFYSILFYSILFYSILLRI
jgi:hypothetical protein